MLKKYNLIDLIKIVKEQLEANTGATVYDTYPPKDAPSPFYFIEFVKTTEIKSKVYFVDNYSLYVHAIGSVNGSNAEIYTMIDELRDAMTEDIPLEEPYVLTNQQSDGVLRIRKDETNELHAVVGFSFRIAYGLKIKASASV